MTTATATRHNLEKRGIAATAMRRDGSKNYSPLPLCDVENNQRCRTVMDISAVNLDVYRILVTDVCTSNKSNAVGLLQKNVTWLSFQLYKKRHEYSC